MGSNNRKIRIAVSVTLQDAGEATRSMEIAKGLRETCPSGWEIEFIFLSYGSRFEERVIDNGFSIYPCEPKLPGIGFHADLKPSACNIVGNCELAVAMLKGQIKALEAVRPDLVLYGFWPFASIARRMMEPVIPGICFLPIPMEPKLFGSYLMRDVPDQLIPLTYLPKAVRKAIIHSIPGKLKLKAPIMRQFNLLEAVERCGWRGGKLNNLFDLLESDLTVVNDIPEFYEGMPIPDNYHITGPLYALGKDDARIEPGILEVFDKKIKKPKIFCTMGSSGTKTQLLEVVKALKSGANQRWNAVILSPPAVCPLTETFACVEGSEGIYITDQFVPAPQVNAMADLVISHGGQGTVQTALACGTPVVGVAMQPEQQINLDNIVAQGAGIRIPAHRWKAEGIRSAAERVLADPCYQTNARRLQNIMNRSDGKNNCARTIWNFIADVLPHK